MRVLCLVPLLAFALYGADVSGNWTGSVDVQDPGNGSNISARVRAELVQQDETVNGKIGREQDNKFEPIRNGKLSGKSLTFEVKPEEVTSAIKFMLTVVSDDRIEGELSGAIDAAKFSGKVVLTRTK